MEFENELNIRDNKAYKLYPSFVCENYQKPSMRCDLIIPIDKTSSSKSNSLQDFHHLDHQFHAHRGSSSNPNFLSPFDHFEAGNSSNLISFSGQVANSLQNSGDQNMNFPCKNPNIDMININNDSDWSCLPLNSQGVIAKPMSSVVPNQDQALSCITAENGYYKNVVVMNKNTRTYLTKKGTNKGQKIKANPVKGQWKGEEDRLLIQLVDQYGLRKWSHIAQMLPGRIGKQCRERWHNHLRPNIKKDTWTEEEDKVLIESHVEVGNKWADIAKRLPGRTENSIKNHWNTTKRRQYSRRKCRSAKCPRASLLQDYIKSLNLDPSAKISRPQHTRKSTSSNDIGIIISNSPINRDRLIDDQDYDQFGDDPDFCFGKNMIFQEGCGTIDSLFDDINATICADDHDENAVPVVDLPAEDNNVDNNAVMLEENYVDQVVMKKELDLVEMISQVNKVK